MSAESQKDRERLKQAAKVFFFHIRDLISFINTFVELFNLTMKTQILPIVMKEDSRINDFFEQMIKNFKEMQLVVDAKHSKMPKELLCSRVAAAVSSAVEQCTSLGLHHSAKEMFKTMQIPCASSILRSSHFFGILESSLSFLMKFPIMQLRLSDFYQEDTKEKSEATASESEEGTSAECSQATLGDSLKKVQNALRTEGANESEEAAADQLEQFLSAMEPTLQVLQKAVKTMETDISEIKKASSK